MLTHAQQPDKYTDPSGHLGWPVLAALSPVGWVAIGAGTVAIVGGTYYYGWGPDANVHRQDWAQAAARVQNSVENTISEMGKNKGRDGGWNPADKVALRNNPVRSIEEGIKSLSGLCKERPVLCVISGTAAAAHYISGNAKLDEEGEESEHAADPAGESHDRSADQSMEGVGTLSPQSTSGTPHATDDETMEDPQLITQTTATARGGLTLTCSPQCEKRILM